TSRRRVRSRHTGRSARAAAAARDRIPDRGRPRRDASVSTRALVFDFDGLILETETPAYRAWVEIYREFGHELPKALWLDYIGREGGWFDALAYLEGLTGPQPD